MITLLERDFLKNYKFTSYVIGSLQKSYAQGFLNDAETDAERNEIQSFINDKYDFIKFYSSHYDEDFVCNRILHIDVNNIERYLEVFTERFEALLKNVGVEKVIVVLNAKCDWFYQKNNYKPVKEAMLQLRKIVGGKHYYGGFEVDTNFLRHMIKIIFWIGRCNASLPYIHIISEENKTSFMICKYGNLHAECYSLEMDKKISEISKKLEFEIIEKEEEFLKNGLEGRKIIV